MGRHPAQLIHRQGKIFLWSRGEELITERLPELVEAAARLPDGVVLDGEVLAWDEQGVLPFAVLQTRIGRDRLTARSLERAPVIFLAFDLLEESGVDLRSAPLEVRRARLEAVVEGAGRRLSTSPILQEPDWPALAALRAEARQRRVEGLMLKRRDSVYGAGRQRGAWWKWQVDPLRVAAVLVYAQAGSRPACPSVHRLHLRRWRGAELVPIAKADCGLSEPEILALDRWIRRHTLERFGPVRQVLPELVFELAFAGIAPSARHKSGLALRFPRIARWRTDKPAAAADRLEQVLALLPEGSRA